MKSNPNPSFYPVLPYESLSSCASINKKRKRINNNNNQKLKEKKIEKDLNYHKWPLTDL